MKLFKVEDKKSGLVFYVKARSSRKVWNAIHKEFPSLSRAIAHKVTEWLVVPSEYKMNVSIIK